MLVDELKDAALDFWVARFEGYEPVLDEKRGTLIALSEGAERESFAPSQQWKHGGPLIEKHRITLNTKGDQWYALIPSLKISSHGRVGIATADAPLIAAMRALVKSHYGDEVVDTATAAPDPS